MAFLFFSESCHRRAIRNSFRKNRTVTLAPEQGSFFYKERGSDNRFCVVYVLQRPRACLYALPKEQLAVLAAGYGLESTDTLDEIRRCMRDTWTSIRTSLRPIRVNADSSRFHPNETRVYKSSSRAPRLPRAMHWPTSQHRLSPTTGS